MRLHAYLRAKPYFRNIFSVSNAKSLLLLYYLQFAFCAQIESQSHKICIHIISPSHAQIHLEASAEIYFHLKPNICGAPHIQIQIHLIIKIWNVIREFSMETGNRNGFVQQQAFHMHLHLHTHTSCRDPHSSLCISIYRMQISLRCALRIALFGFRFFRNLLRGIKMKCISKSVSKVSMQRIALIRSKWFQREIILVSFAMINAWNNNNCMYSWNGDEPESIILWIGTLTVLHFRRAWMAWRKIC